MTAFESIKLSPEFNEALSGKTAYANDEDGGLMKVRPPEQNNGIDTSVDLLRSFHDYREEDTLLSTMNVSDTCAFEVWYDREELQFMYYTPTKEREEHYRRQVDGHFKGCRIEDVRDQFVSTQAGDYVTGGEVWLNNHFFEPIRSPKNEDWDDPYLLLFSELDTRDETRTMIQLLFRPAERDWTRTAWETVDEYAESMTEKRTQRRLFGLLSSTRDATADEKEYASKITRQAERPAYYVNLRYVVVGTSEQTANIHAENVAKRLQLGYEEVSGQTLATDPCDTPEEVAELLRKVAAREPSNMPDKRGLWEDFKRARFGDPRKNMVMTLNEIAGLTHFPKAKNIGIEAIEWTDRSVDGSLPHNANRFSRLDDDERTDQLERWIRQQRQLCEDLGIDPDEIEALGEGNPRDKQIEREILSTMNETDTDEALMPENETVR